MAILSHLNHAHRMRKSPLRARLLTAISVLLLTASGIISPVSAKISEKITANSINTPAYIIDAHASDGDATTLRNGLKTRVVATFTRNFFDAQFSGNYRITYQLIDKNGSPLRLDNAIPGDDFTATTSFFTVTATSIFETQPLTIYPDPQGTLNNTEPYFVSAKLQHRLNFSTAWSDISGSGLKSTEQYIHHFTQPTSGDAELNIRATVKNLQWERKFALNSSASLNAFQASVDVNFARFDDWKSGIKPTSTTLQLDFDLFEKSTGLEIPLLGNGIVSQSWSAANYLEVVNTKEPAYQLMNTTVSLIPKNQLKSASSTYILRCTVKHIEVTPSSFYTDTQIDLDPEDLLHFNGALLFGTIETRFDDLGNTPLFGVVGPSFVNTTIKVPAGNGSLPQNSQYIFGSNALLSVQLYDSGQAVVTAGSEQVLDSTNASAAVEHTNNHITLTYGTVTLSTSGVSTSSVKVNLPQGNIYLADTTLDSHRGVDFITKIAPTTLNASLNIAASIEIPLGNDAAIVDESHPLIIQSKHLTVNEDGSLIYSDILGVSHIHSINYAYLEFGVNSGEIEPSDDSGKPLQLRVSNDRYWKMVNAITSPNVKVTAESDQSARMTADFAVDAEDYETHFPAYTKISWNGAANIELVAGVMVGNSALIDISLIDQPYYQTCPEDPCATKTPKEPQSFEPADFKMLFTPSGGLYNQGKLMEVKPLAWGARGDGAGGIHPDFPYAHRTNDFNTADLYIPGYHLYASENPLLSTPPYAADGGDNAPGALLLAGFNGSTKNPQLHFPTDSEYTNGDGYYPGVNVAVSAPGREGASRIGGNTVDYPYELVPGGASKYYTRCAGVFGRQVAQDGSFDPSLNIYGYDFELTSFQITFIASEQLDKSWINGAISITGHSDFIQEFTGLQLNCLGELGRPTIDTSEKTNKTLVYWNSQFTPLAMDFKIAPTSAPGDCPQTFTGFLTMGISTKVAHISNKLYGTFAFSANNGNLLTKTTGSSIGVDSELGIPANLSIDAPAKNYTLVTTGKLRFSNPDENPNAVEGSPGGFVTFASTINVPYFQDLQVQVMTSANSSPTAPLYLAPGWTSAGETFFSNSEFDPNHTSWPKGSISIEEYQQPDTSTAASYLIKAEQDLFGIVPLSYPLKWDDGSRTFTSMNAINDNLLVINVDHQVDYMDAATTHVSFGAQYDGLPKISLTTLLNDEIDGAASSVSEAISAPLKGAIDSAFAEFDKLLADSLDAAIEPVVDEAATQVLDPLYEELKTQYDLSRNAGDDWNNFKSKMLTEVTGRIYNSGGGNPGLALGSQLEKISQAAGDAASLTTDLQLAIEQIITGIDAITAQVELAGGVPQFNLEPPSPSDSVKDGLLKKNNGQRLIVQRLVELLLQNLVAPELAAILMPLLNDATSDLNKVLNATLEEINPALDQITASLLQVREFLVDVRTQIIDQQGFIADFQALVDQAAVDASEFSDIQQKTAARIISFIEDIARDNNIDLLTGTTKLDTRLDLFEEFDKEQFITAVKTELTDSILESELIEQYQFLLRQTLYDLQNKMEQTVASVLAQVSGVMKDLISDTVGAIEDEITPMLGDINEYMGSASVVGYANFNGDSLRKVRIDSTMQFKLPDELQLDTFLEINAYTSEDESNGCVGAGERAVEVVIGATNVPMNWISDGLRADISAKLSLKDHGSGLRPNGVGGEFKIIGVIDFQTFKITTFAATMAIGGDEAFLGARGSGYLDDYEVSLGVFFGRTCSVDPLILVDSDVGSLFSSTMPLTGAYAYGEVWLPISELVLGIPASCLFNISAGVGTGVGFFMDDALSPIFVGKMFAGISGEALCVISIKGSVTMVGIIQDGSFSASGTGRLKGKAGACPFCIKFSASAKVSYSDGDWDVDY